MLSIRGVQILINRLIGLRDQRESAVAAIQRWPCGRRRKLKCAHGDDQKAGGGSESNGQGAAQRMSAAIADGQLQQGRAAAGERGMRIGSQQPPNFRKCRCQDQGAGA